VDVLLFDKTAGGGLYASGEFKWAGNLSTPANRIAKWSGSTWSALGSGLNRGAHALACDGKGNLYAAGAFDTAGSRAVGNIAKWDGSSWSALGTGLKKYAAALVFDKSGNLYAGGEFDTAGGIPAKHIAKWDGTSWSALATDMDSGVSSLACDRMGNLYIGGYFTTIDGVKVNRVAKWDGKNWSALGSGTSDGVYSLTIFRDTLYVGGMFASAGAVVSPGIAKVALHLPISVLPSARASSSSAISYRINRSDIVFSNVSTTDHISLFSLSGRLLHEAEGVSKITLSRFSPQPLIVRVNRAGRIVLTGMVMRQ
jgi:hypothetical protein